MVLYVGMDDGEPDDDSGNRGVSYVKLTSRCIICY